MTGTLARMLDRMEDVIAGPTMDIIVGLIIMVRLTMVHLGIIGRLTMEPLGIIMVHLTNGAFSRSASCGTEIWREQH
jgi:hypothetical protein